ENQAKARGQHRAERPICQLPEWNLSTLSPEKSKGTKAESHGALVCVAPMVKGRFLGMCLLLVAAAGLADGKGKGKKQGVRLLDAGRLEKFVDELPDIPVLRGYGVAERGRLVAGELAVGMYDTMWRVRAHEPHIVGLFFFLACLLCVGISCVRRRTRRVLVEVTIHCSVLFFSSDISRFSFIEKKFPFLYFPIMLVTPKVTHKSTKLF
uniref:Uncharacterized protein n=1 Tax=Aegilops tauschii subsp. strangulata TaxID=200361 RepID=A0A452XLV1_AEGTS